MKKLIDMKWVMTFQISPHPSSPIKSFEDKFSKRGNLVVLFVNMVTYREGRRAVSSRPRLRRTPLVHRKERNAEETALRHSNATVFTNRAT